MTKLTSARAAALSVSLFGCVSAQALIITDDMSSPPATVPGITNVYPWTGVIFGGTQMGVSGGVLSMSTVPYQGVWFGNGSLIGHNPGWSLGGSTTGNYLSLSLSLSSDAVDWSMYFYDLSGYYAGLTFNPAGSYANAVQHGISYNYKDAANQFATGFAPVDFSNGFHTVEVLLKDGLISYGLDGQLLFQGSAWYSGPTNLLVIGDGSGYSPTGLGTMYVDSVLFDTAPTMTSLVPVPAALPLMLSGLGLCAAVASRRRADV